MISAAWPARLTGLEPFAACEPFLAWPLLNSTLAATADPLDAILGLAVLGVAILAGRLAILCTIGMAIAFRGGLPGLPHKGLHQFILAHVMPAKNLLLPGHFRQFFDRSSLEICCVTHGLYLRCSAPSRSTTAGGRRTGGRSGIPFSRVALRSRSSRSLPALRAALLKDTSRQEPGLSPSRQQYSLPHAAAMHPSPSR